MDFLYKLYSNENFGIVLFVIISILVLAFLIILFFGKKDQKERKLAETKKFELNDEFKESNNSEVAFRENELPVPLEVVKEEPIPVNMDNEPLQTPNMVLNSDLVNDSLNTLMKESIKENESLETPITEERHFDFDALAASISKELENIGNQEKVEEPSVKITEPTFELPTFEKSVPEMTPHISEEEKVEPIRYPEKEEMVREKTEDRKTIPSPTQFSSVFVSRKEKNEIAEEPVKSDIERATVIEPIVEPVKVEPIVEPVFVPPIVEPMPMKPNIELPKPIDLPKLTRDPIPMAKPIIEEKEEANIFNNIIE